MCRHFDHFDVLIANSQADLSFFAQGKQDHRRGDGFYASYYGLYDDVVGKHCKGLRNSHVRGVARIFQKGAHCVTFMVLTTLPCRHRRCVLLKVTFLRISSECGGGGDKSTK